MALGIVTSLLRGRLVPRKGLTALTTKRGPKGFYKGKGCKSTGRHTSKGGYVLMPEKLPIYVVPDLTDFKTISCGRQLTFERSFYPTSQGPGDFTEIQDKLEVIEDDAKRTREGLVSGCITTTERLAFLLPHQLRSNAQMSLSLLTPQAGLSLAGKGLATQSQAVSSKT